MKIGKRTAARFGGAVGIVFGAALLTALSAGPAQAVGSNSASCSFGGMVLSHSTVYGSSYTDGTQCTGTDHVRVRVHYNVSGGGAVTGSWHTSAAYVTYISIGNPGYPVYQGDHSWEYAVSGWQGPISE